MLSRRVADLLSGTLHWRKVQESNPRECELGLGFTLPHVAKGDEYRTPLWQRVWGMVMVLVSAILGALAIVVGRVADAADVPSDLNELGEAFLIITPCLAVVVWLLFIRPKLVVGTEELVVRNPIKTTRVPWCRLVACEDTREGLKLLRCSDGPVIAWAVQASSRIRRRGDPPPTRACLDITEGIRQRQ